MRLFRTTGFSAAVSAALILLGSQADAASLLYNQNFESPNSYNPTVDFDVDSRPVNTLYGNQPAGFAFANSWTVETINVTDSVRPGGQRSFGSTPQGGYYGDLARSGNFVVGMLSTRQNDLLGLTFDITGFDFLNLQIDLTNLDLDCCGAPFHTGSFDTTPDFQFSLFDEAGSSGLGAGALLDRKVFSPGASARNEIDFTTFTFGLDAKDKTDGLVTLQIDLLTGGYAAFDNLRIAASDTEGDVGAIPLPAAGWMMIAAIGGLFGLSRRRRAA